MRKLLFISLIFLIGISVALLLFLRFRGDSVGKPDLLPGKAHITVDATRMVRPVNPRLFGTTMSEARSVSGRRDDLSHPELKRLLNQLQPRFITIQNTSGGIPFYAEGTDAYAKRMTHAQILERLHLTSDPAGKLFYEKIKNEPALKRPPDFNFDDILQYFESLDVKPEIAIRLPTIFTSLTGELAKVKLSIDPQTGSDLVHYLNDPPTTALGTLRGQNGHPTPYNIKYFVLGNELWNNLIHYGLSYEQIASQHIAFAEAMKAADPTIKIGFNLADDSLPHDLFKPDFLEGVKNYIDFNDRVLSRIRGYFDFVTYHVYPDLGIGEMTKPSELTAAQWKFVMAHSYLRETYKSHERHRNPVRKYNPDAEIINDEYSGPLVNLGGALFTADHLMYLLQDGYDAYAGYWNSGLFEPFTRFGLIKVPDDPSRSEYIARPAFYTLQLFTRYFGDTIVDTRVDTDTFDLPETETENFRFPAGQVPSIRALASIKGNKLVIFVLNRAIDQNIETKLEIKGFVPKRRGRISVLHGPSLNATNEDDPLTVKIHASPFTTVSQVFTHTFKKRSLTVLELEK